MTTLPWIKFFPDAWNGDHNLQGCSIAARGLWLQLLCIAHSASPRGELRLPNGEAVDVKTLARLCHVDRRTLGRLVDELEGARVFSRRPDGVIYSRRMVADDEQSRRARDNGKLGGNPNILGAKRDTKWHQNGRVSGPKPLRDNRQGDNPTSIYPLQGGEPLRLRTITGGKSASDDGPFLPHGEDGA